MICIGNYQEKGYNSLIKNIDNIEDMDGFGYTILSKPLEALNIVFPNEKNNYEEITGR